MRRSTWHFVPGFYEASRWDEEPWESRELVSPGADVDHLECLEGVPGMEGMEDSDSDLVGIF